MRCHLRFEVTLKNAFGGLVEANFAENGGWEHLSNLAATLMAIETSLSNFP
jgi:hypothetical protein